MVIIPVSWSPSSLGLSLNSIGFSFTKSTSLSVGQSYTSCTSAEKWLKFKDCLSSNTSVIVKGVFFTITCTFFWTPFLENFSSSRQVCSAIISFCSQINQTTQKNMLSPTTGMIIINTTSKKWHKTKTTST